VDTKNFPPFQEAKTKIKLRSIPTIMLRRDFITRAAIAAGSLGLGNGPDDQNGTDLLTLSRLQMNLEPGQPQHWR